MGGDHRERRKRARKHARGETQRERESVCVCVCVWVSFEIGCVFVRRLDRAKHGKLSSEKDRDGSEQENMRGKRQREREK